MLGGCEHRQEVIEGQRVRLADLEEFKRSKAIHAEQLVVKVTTVQCAECLAQIDKDKLPEHRYHCAENAVRCTLGCGATLKRREMQVIAGWFLLLGGSINRVIKCVYPFVVDRRTSRIPVQSAMSNAACASSGSGLRSSAGIKASIVRNDE